MSERQRLQTALESTRSALQSQRVRVFETLGCLSENVLARNSPLVETKDGFAKIYWPWHAIGKIRIIRTDQNVLLVTDGLSDPWNPNLHEKTPPFTFGLELALEVPTRFLQSSSDADIAESWMPTVLWAVTDCLVASCVNLKAQLIRFDCTTLPCPPLQALESSISSTGHIGLLVGIPLIGDKLCAQVNIAPEPLAPDESIWLLPLKLLTADEYDWLLQDHSGKRTIEMANAFLRAGDRHLSWPQRDSCLPALAGE